MSAPFWEKTFWKPTISSGKNYFQETLVFETGANRKVPVDSILVSVLFARCRAACWRRVHPRHSSASIEVLANAFGPRHLPSTAARIFRMIAIFSAATTLAASAFRRFARAFYKNPELFLGRGALKGRLAAKLGSLVALDGSCAGISFLLQSAWFAWFCSRHLTSDQYSATDSILNIRFLPDARSLTKL